MPDVFHLLALIPLSLLAVFCRVIRLQAMAWFLRRQNVDTTEIKKWALEQATKEGTGRIGAIIAAWRKDCP